jgi:DnaJ-class molecular chaperone
MSEAMLLDCRLCGGSGETIDGKVCRECDGSGDDPEDAARLRLSRAQVARSEIHPGIEGRP